ncbi:MAG: ATP-grasp domain-containing protein [Lachnospiraceae bacterium]|nr:ATP-grasp domain-containing protein [Lachnospiraceae bacterium]
MFVTAEINLKISLISSSGSAGMGRVWMKVKYDAVMKMDVPHSLNIATAMYGFREMGAEVIPYHNLDEVYDDIKREDIVLDYIDQCVEVFRKFGVVSALPDYPDVLNPFLGRKMWRDTVNHVSTTESLWSAGYFIKPVKEKAFTGKKIHNS